MKRVIKSKVILLLTIVVCFLLQSTVLHTLALAYITPNLLIIVTSAFGFMRGHKDGMFVGFVSGILVDIFYGDLIGFYALIYMLIGYLNGYFQRMFYDEDIKLPLFMIGASDLVYGIMVFFFQYVLRSRLKVGYYVGHIIIPELVYTILVTLLVYQILRMINRKLEAAEKRSASKFV